MKKTIRADHVGSLLRPPELLEAREAHAAGRLPLNALREKEESAILGVVQKQRELGLDIFTDGELRRGSWLTDMAEAVEILKNKVFIHWILNAWGEPLDFELPTQCGQWNRCIDTSLEPPEDIVRWEEGRPVLRPSYLAAPHSVVVLFSTTPQQTAPR